MERPSGVSFSHFRRSSAPSATLIEKHEIRRKREVGVAGERRGQMAAAVDAAGAALGALGMVAFAIVFSLMVESSIVVAFIGSSLAWLVVSVAAWRVRRKMRSVRKASTCYREPSGPSLSAALPFSCQLLWPFLAYGRSRAGQGHSGGHAKICADDPASDIASGARSSAAIHTSAAIRWGCDAEARGRNNDLAALAISGIAI